MKHFLLFIFFCVGLVNVMAQPFSQTTIGSGLSNPANITRVDLDKDGDQDVLCFEGDNNIIYFMNNGDGTYTSSNVYSWLDSPRYFEVVDMDNDGEFDIVANSIGDDQTVFLKNNGDESFTQSFITNGNSDLYNPGYFAIANFDEDNLKDMVISASAAVAIDDEPLGLFFIQNNGSGSFGTPSEIVVDEDMIQRVAAGDFDSDNDMDIIVTQEAYFSTNGLFKGVNDGSGNFTYSAIDASYKCTLLQAEDIDGDTDVDFVVRRSDNTIFWYENDGSFSFTAHQIEHTQSDLIYFQVIDADQDTDMDLFFYTSINASISESRFKVGVLVNDGSENFTESILLDNQDEIESAIAFNLDDDGDLDFIVGSYQHQNVILYQNLEIDNPTAVKNINDVAVTLYPNPTANKLYITCSEVISNVEISDLTGRINKQVEVGKAIETIDVSCLNPGVYNVLLQTSTQNIVRRIVKK